jgi:hypothetical protein
MNQWSVTRALPKEIVDAARVPGGINEYDVLFLVRRFVASFI